MPERSFGRTVRYRRTKLGLSQARLAELVGRSSSTVRSWERGQSAPTEASVLHALAAVLGVDERSIFEKAGQEPPPEMDDSPTVEEALATLSRWEEPDHRGKSDPDLEDESEAPGPEPTGPQPDDEPRAYAGRGSDLSGPGYVAPPEPYVITPTLPPVVEPSYMEDQSQRQLYRVRNLATLVAVVALMIALIWAVSESLGAFGSWWDQFFGSLRL